MKTLVTHINPHLDDIAAIWLFRRLNPGFENAKIKFLSATNSGVTFDNEPVDSNPDIIHFGIGRGKYDEHKGDTEECATSLVWKDLKNTLTNEIEKASLEEMVQWATLEDTGKLPVEGYWEFSIPAFIRPRDNNEESSLRAIELGKEILDRILRVLKTKQQAIKDWEIRQELETKFGKTVAIASETVNREFCREKGGDLFIMYGPKSGFVQYFTPSHEIDLEPIYKRVKDLDPEASWFLHQSHHMVICGSGSAPDSKKTKLSFQELIDAAKSI